MVRNHTCQCGTTCLARKPLMTCTVSWACRLTWGRQKQQQAVHSKMLRTLLPTPCSLQWQQTPGQGRTSNPVAPQLALPLAVVVLVGAVLMQLALLHNSSSRRRGSSRVGVVGASGRLLHQQHHPAHRPTQPAAAAIWTSALDCSSDSSSSGQLLGAGSSCSRTCSCAVRTQHLQALPCHSSWAAGTVSAQQTGARGPGLVLWLCLRLPLSLLTAVLVFSRWQEGVVKGALQCTCCCPCCRTAPLQTQKLS